MNGPYEAFGEFLCSFCVAFEGCIGKDQYMRPLRICFRRIPIVAHTAEFRLAVFRQAVNSGFLLASLCFPIRVSRDYFSRNSHMDSSSFCAGRYQPGPRSLHHENAGRFDHNKSVFAINSRMASIFFHPSSISVQPLAKPFSFNGFLLIKPHAAFPSTSDRSSPCLPSSETRMTMPRIPPSSNSSPSE